VSLFPLVSHCFKQRLLFSPLLNSRHFYTSHHFSKQEPATSCGKSKNNYFNVLSLKDATYLTQIAIQKWKAMTDDTKSDSCLLPNRVAEVNTIIQFRESYILSLMQKEALAQDEILDLMHYHLAGKKLSLFDTSRANYHAEETQKCSELLVAIDQLIQKILPDDCTSSESELCSLLSEDLSDQNKIKDIIFIWKCTQKELENRGHKFAAIYCAEQVKKYQSFLK
jgi:hypothetical protein